MGVSGGELVPPLESTRCALGVIAESTNSVISEATCRRLNQDNYPFDIGQEYERHVHHNGNYAEACVPGLGRLSL